MADLREYPYAADIPQNVPMARMALCPMAAKPQMPLIDPEIRSIAVGSFFSAWTQTNPGPPFSSSYGFNMWAFQVQLWPDGSLKQAGRVFPVPPDGHGLNVFNVAGRSKFSAKSAVT